VVDQGIRRPTPAQYWNTSTARGADAIVEGPIRLANEVDTDIGGNTISLASIADIVGQFQYYVSSGAIARKP